MLDNRIKLSDKVPRGLNNKWIFEPLIDLLLKNGNELAYPYRWSVDQTGYSCALSKPLDFELIERTFKLPPDTIVSREHNVIDYGLGTVSVYTKSPKSW